MLLRLTTLVLVATLLVSTVRNTESKNLKQLLKKVKDKTLGNTDISKLQKFEKYIERHDPKFQSEKFWNKINDKAAQIKDDFEDLSQPMEPLAQDEAFNKDDKNYQHEVLRREADPQNEYRHTILSRSNSPLQLVRVDSPGTSRSKRAVAYPDSSSWPFRIPYVFDPSYLAVENGVFASLFTRVVKYIGQQTCFTYVDETDNYDPSDPNWFINNGYEINSHMLVKYDPNGGCAASRGAGNLNAIKGISPCLGFQINLHEVLHTLGAGHTQASPIRDNYITISVDNIQTNILQWYINKNPAETHYTTYYDASSTLSYGQYTWNTNGLETYLPIRDDIFEGIGISNEEIAFKNINEVFQCAAVFCPNDTRDCGEGYLAYRNGSCRCVCPRFYDAGNDCQTMINGPSSVSWPDVPFALFKAGTNVSCPEGFDQQHGGFSHKGYWRDYQQDTLPQLFEAVDETTYFQVCTKPGPSTPDWELVPPGGEYCFIKPENVSCGFGNAGVLEFESYEDVEHYGNLGDISISGNKTVIKMCCMPDYKKGRNMEVEFPNTVPFRLVARGSCPIVRGMKMYRGMTDFYTTEKLVTGTGQETPQYYIFKWELQLFHCYYQPPVYGCNEEHTLDSTNRIVTVTTPGYNVAREPDRRCFYIFHAPEGAKLKVTFVDYDVLEDDDVILQRYNVWQQPYRLDNNNYPEQVVSESNFLSVELWTSDMTTDKRGINLTVEVLLVEESCYDPAQNGADYLGSTSISEVYEDCIDWTEAVNCFDFPYTSEGAIWLLTPETENKCRNPDGDLLGPYCYTYINGTNCRKRYCDVCGYKDVTDVVKTCAELMAEDPDFCNSGVQRFGCFQSCGFPVETHDTSCPEGWTQYVNRCYKYIDTPMTHADAEEHCNSFNQPGTLFKVLSEEDQQFIDNLRDFLNYSSQDLWISGHFNHNVGDWTVTGGNEILVYRNFDHDPGCELDWEPSKNRCFKMFIDQGKVTANTAAQNCRAFSPNGTLFRVFDETDQLQVRQYKNDMGDTYLDGSWISGYLVQVIPGQAIGDWRYTDSNTELTYMEWTKYEDPNNLSWRCIRMYSENYWIPGGHRAMRCDSGKAYYVCQVDKSMDFNDKECIYVAQNSSWMLESCSTSQVEKQFICQINNAAECFTPTIPADGYVTTPLKESYRVGEKVSIYCNTSSANPPVSEIICRGESGWTQLNHACIECPLGWAPFDNTTCIKIFTEGLVTNDEAATTCRAQADSGTLFRIHDEIEQEMITLYRQKKGSPYNQDVSISGQLVQELQGQEVGQWSFHDDLENSMTYFNWSSYEDANNSSRDCIRLYSQDDGTLADYWRSVDCGEGGGTAYFICQIDRLDVGCEDNINECQGILTSFPQFCTDPKTVELAEHYCYKSCGRCYENSHCSTPSSTAYDRISLDETIIPGDVMEFECKPGYYHVGGDLKRACGSDGSLLGQEPDCQTTPVAEDVNLRFLRRRGSTVARRRLYLLDHPQYRVPFDGNITRWHYYSDAPGNLNFTVFRKSGNNYNYVGANWISAEADWPWSYIVPPANQISVLKDDIVGFYSDDYNTLFVSDCSNDPDKLVVVPFVGASTFATAKTVTTFPNTGCIIPSFGYRVAP